jgi:N6-adenosine-specific RNA methylase IME4
VAELQNWPFKNLKPRNYRTVALDPPWKFSAGTKGRPQHYKRMTDAEIAALPIAELCHPDGANILLWIPSCIDGPRFWQNIFPAWKRQGLRFSARAFIWLKLKERERMAPLIFIAPSSLHTGMGFTTRKNAEDCLLLKYRKPKRLRKDIHEIIIAPVREHSQKPEEFYERAEAYSAGPYADVFSREDREGWDSFGDEAGKFNVVAE